MHAAAPIAPLPRCPRPLLLRSTPMIGFCLPLVPLRSYRKTLPRIEATDHNEHPSFSGMSSSVMSTVGKSTNIVWYECAIGKHERQQLLKQKGCVVWITGLSGSGKSTVACALSRELYSRGYLAYVLDGDNLRHGLNRDLSFNAEDRAENIRRVGEVAKLFADAGIICIASLISPYRSERDACRALVPDSFIEVFMDMPLELCEARDPKGLYKLARAGKIKGFTGIDDPYEPPLNCELVIQPKDGECSSPSSMAEQIIRSLQCKVKAKPTGTKEHSLAVKKSGDQFAQEALYTSHYELDSKSKGGFWYLLFGFDSFEGWRGAFFYCCLLFYFQCLVDPPKPQYRGGIIINPEFNNGLNGWLISDHSNIAVKTSETGNKFSVAQSGENPHQSLSQKVYLHSEKIYTFSAWVQISDGDDQTPVTAIFKTSSGSIHEAGSVIAKSGCWSMLKGGISVNKSGPSKFYFESENTSVDIWIDSVSLQPFTKEQWRRHQTESINKVRKRKVRINSKPGTKISIRQSRPGFPFGNAISKTILSNSGYQNWFSSRFTVTTFEDEMKWYSNEVSPGNENYADADAMLAFCKQHGIKVRGHNVFWDDPQYQQGWLKSLPTPQLQAATDKRMNSIINRYKGQVIAWDVVNENLHFSFFESKLGGNASSIFFQKLQHIDNNVLMFLNDFNTLEEPGDVAATPSKYLQKLREIQGFVGSGARIAIGLESHFKQLNTAYMRSALDTLAGAKVPIWLTEVDVASSPQQAKYLEEILREAFAHPAVQGIVMWGSWHPQGCYRMCLTDNNFKNLPTGDVVDKLLKEWKTKSQFEGIADINGFFELDLFHGEYEITTSHPSSNSSSLHMVKVDGGDGHEGMLQVSVVHS
ncbi:hypothetical protein J5N97_015661 [Dioscorea zingiberensis]|uniref:adenylyl-sulfate kinase n=1 Tax=Dioscorea zingiberensis TaxID=325984 RepID=A0A9D5HEG7_9LILI|nr:hypothetical protein J5N97_015661 [Dioscorea zingiberensis]